jgi:ferredoxin
MATLIINGSEVDLPDGDEIIEYIEDAGVPIGCSDGNCGTCKVRVLEGASNLCEPTMEEEEFGVAAPARLGCQCVILRGKVVLETISATAD